MEALELVLFLLAAVVASSILDSIIPKISLPLVQIALGAVIAVFWVTPLESGIDAELLLILFIAPLHFNESRHADSGAIWANRWGIFSLAFGLVFAIIVSVGFTLHALIPAIPLAAAIAFGAAMGSTDAVAATELSKDFRLGKRHGILLTGEAFFNDVTGTVVFQCAIAFALSGAFSLMHAGEEFLLDFFGGVFGGAVMGFLAWALLEFIRRRGIDSPTLHVTLELLLPFVIYLISEQIHIGGVIAVVVAGMIMSLMPTRHTAQSARQKLQSHSIWETISFILNGVIFVILGMQLPRLLEPAVQGSATDTFFLLGIIILLTLVLEGVRLIWILGMDCIHAKRDGRKASAVFQSKSLKEAFAMAFSGPKGGITLSLMLTIPYAFSDVDGFPVRALLISLTAGVILCTLILANFAVPALVPHKHEQKRRKDRIDMEIGLLEKVIDSIVRDSHMTGSIKGGAERIGFDELEEMDEPATAIVMKKYSDQIAELIPLASDDVSKRAREVVKKCDALYDAYSDIAQSVADMDDYTDDDGNEGTSEDLSDTIGLSDRIKIIRKVQVDVDDIQAQALNRELEFIRDMSNAGELDPDQAKALRNDVYVQQMTI